MNPVVIVSAKRTPMGGMQGVLSGFTAAQLGGVALKAALSGLSFDAIDEVIMGNVLGAGQGQAPARQALRAAGIHDGAGALTINKMCGSGLKAAMLAHDLIQAGSAKVVLAGGMESMTNAPYLLAKARGGYRYGHGELLDHMALDGLEDAYERRTPMGVFAERTVEKYGFTREQQDAFAIESLKRAQKAAVEGKFAAEIAPVEIASKAGVELLSQDEQPSKGKPDKIPSLKPAFKKDGTITAANASSISDGAAALLMMSLSEAERRGLQPLAKVVGHSSHARLPAEFTIAPCFAITDLLNKCGWSKESVDFWEINEAFACVTMAAMHTHGLPHEKVNVHGGACALGHPIGASGARIVATLLGAMQAYGGKRGIATLCIGGGEAVAMALESF
jgi:acetyl-CoA C-acetyltransferase